jgi:hypothetical protein
VQQRVRVRLETCEFASKTVRTHTSLQQTVDNSAERLEKSSDHRIRFAQADSMGTAGMRQFKSLALDLLLIAFATLLALVIRDNLEFSWPRLRAPTR